MIRHALGRAPRAAGLAARSLAVPLRAPAARQQQTASLRSWAAAPLGPARQPALLCQRRCFGDAGTLEIKTPDFGAESITEGTLMEWQKQVGDFCAKGDILAVIETDKVSVEVKAVENGTVQELLAKADDTVEVGQVLAVLKLGGTPPPKAAAAPAAKPAAAPAAPTPKPSAPAAAPAAPAAAAQPAVAAPAAPKPAPPVPRPPAKGGKAAVPFWEVAFRKHWYG